MRLVNEPKFVSYEDYVKHISNYVSRIEPSDEILAIYQMGSIRAPGLSDIDLIIVVKDEISQQELLKISSVTVDTNLFLHAPVVLPHSLVDQLQYLIYASNLRLLSGQAILSDFRNLPLETQKNLSICYLIDFLESRFVQLSQMDAQKVDKRRWLTRIWSVLHSCRLYENYFQELTQTEGHWVEQIKLTRVQWSEQGCIDDAVFQNAFDAHCKLMKSLFQRVLNLVYGDPQLLYPFSFFDGEKIMHFDQCVLYPIYGRLTKNVCSRKLELSTARYNLKYLAHLSAYRSELKIQWLNPPQDNNQRLEVQRERFETVRCHHAWLKQKQFSAYSLSGYVGMSTESKISVKRCLKKFLLTRAINCFKVY